MARGEGENDSDWDWDWDWGDLENRMYCTGVLLEQIAGEGLDGGLGCAIMWGVLRGVEMGERYAN